MAQELYASVDLGGTKIACAFADAEGHIVAEDRAPTESYEGPENVLKRIARLINDLAEQVGQRPAAVGMAVPGLADLPNGTTLFLPNLPGQWRNVPVRDLLTPQVGCPVYLLNDVRTATLGELTFGHGKTAKTMAFFALGTGIGGGIAIDGKLRLGPLGAAGELGHLIIEPDGPLCGCGNRGCMEALASGPAITAEGVRLMLIGQAPRMYDMVEGDYSRVTPKVMAEAAAAGDEPIKQAIIRAAQYLAIGICNVIVTIHPDLVVLGGGVANIGALLFDTVRATVQERVRMIPPETVRIEPSLLGDRAGTLGGIALAMKRGQVA